jgi:hypothetical protein
MARQRATPDFLQLITLAVLVPKLRLGTHPSKLPLRVSSVSVISVNSCSSVRLRVSSVFHPWLIFVWSRVIDVWTYRRANATPLAKQIYFRSSILHPLSSIYLVPRLCLGTHCVRGSASPVIFHIFRGPPVSVVRRSVSVISVHSCSIVRIRVSSVACVSISFGADKPVSTFDSLLSSTTKWQKNGHAKNYPPLFRTAIFLPLYFFAIPLVVRRRWTSLALRFSCLSRLSWSPSFPSSLFPSLLSPFTPVRSSVSVFRPCFLRGLFLYFVVRELRLNQPAG